ncbi:MAG: N-acetylneuraminate synthase family protein [Desulfobacterales bacterium]
MTVRFIAEVSSNHHQDLKRCLRFIDEAARVGCDGVKFQLFKVDELFSQEVFTAQPETANRKQWELPVQFLPDLAARCREKGLLFSVTPFYLKAVEELYPYVDFYKIASYELLWEDLLKSCARTGKPVVLSTGMADMDEIQHAVEIIVASVPSTQDWPCTDFPPLTLLHCVSGYPAPPDQCNLAAIQTLREAFASYDISAHGSGTGRIEIGWSDHSVRPGVIYRAVHGWGAEMIEFHLDLEGEGEEFSTGHCWLPEGIKNVIDAVKTGFNADGSGVKSPAPSEMPDRDWRADPIDGLRPLKNMRNKLVKGNARK